MDIGAVKAFTIMRDDIDNIGDGAGTLDQLAWSADKINFLDIAHLRQILVIEDAWLGMISHDSAID